MLHPLSFFSLRGLVRSPSFDNSSASFAQVFFPDPPFLLLAIRPRSPSPEPFMFSRPLYFFSCCNTACFICASRPLIGTTLVSCSSSGPLSIRSSCCLGGFFLVFPSRKKTVFFFYGGPFFCSALASPQLFHLPSCCFLKSDVPPFLFYPPS